MACAESALTDTGLEGDYLRGAEVVRGVLSEPLFWLVTRTRAYGIEVWS